VATSLFSSNSIAIREKAPSFLAAIQDSAELLSEAGFTTSDYVHRVLANLETLGPYFVVAPGIAIAHAAPGSDVLKPGMSLLKLNQPVLSGAKENDPVSLIFSLCTPDPEQHVEALGNFAQLMSDPGVVNSLLNASAKSVIWEILKT
jgi:ascorbate PTS system EIIA or EIIAB component